MCCVLQTSFLFRAGRQAKSGLICFMNTAILFHRKKVAFIQLVKMFWLMPECVKCSVNNTVPCSTTLMWCLQALESNYCQKELAYVSVTDSSPVWEVMVAHRWKLLTLELASWIEDKWKQDQKKAQMKDYVHVSAVHPVWKANVVVMALHVFDCDDDLKFVS